MNRMHCPGRAIPNLDAVTSAGFSSLQEWRRHYHTFSIGGCFDAVMLSLTEPCRCLNTEGFTPVIGTMALRQYQVGA